MSHITFPINSGQFNVLIDPEDLPRLTGHGWCLNGDGYVVANLGDCKSMPGALWARYLLAPPADMVIIHLNDDKLDCRRANISAATSSPPVTSPSSAKSAAPEVLPNTAASNITKQPVAGRP